MQIITQNAAYHHDAIIVLAHLMHADGRLNDESRARMDMAAGLFKAGAAPFLVTTGWSRGGKYPVSVGVAMHDYAVSEHGISTVAILTDTHARDTVGDAVFTKRNIIKPRDWKKILVVTSAYHVPRASEIFAFIYGNGYVIEVKGAPYDANPHASEEKSLAAFRDTFKAVDKGDDKAIFHCLLELHPLYNGQLHTAYRD